MEINYSDILINQKDGEKGLTKIEYTWKNDWLPSFLHPFIP
jgi:hypothetical protein